MIVAIVAFGSAIFGALVGAAGALLLDVWRRTLDGVSSARLIRMELIRNQTVVLSVLQSRSVRPALDDGTWRRYAVAVALLLTEIELAKLARDIAIVAVMQADLDRIHDYGENDVLVASVQDWATDLGAHCQALKRIEQASKLKHMSRLLFGGRPSSPQELVTAFAPDLPKGARAIAPDEKRD